MILTERLFSSPPLSITLLGELLRQFSPNLLLSNQRQVEETGRRRKLTTVSCWKAHTTVSNPLDLTTVRLSGELEFCPQLDSASG